MLHLSVLRWGQPYQSLDIDQVVHFQTGEPIARVGRANGGLIQRDMRKAARARDVLREIPIAELIARVGKAGELYANAELPLGDGSQTPDEFVRAQSGSTGIPERLCRGNMKKNTFVLAEMRRILESLTRGLDLDVLTRGYGEERGVPISLQAESPVLGLVLPSNSPGVHTLWLPVIPMQIGLVLKPGPQEPWTPFRMAEAFFAAGIPREAISIYPGEGDVGAAVLEGCGRSLIFGGTATVDRYRGNPRVQAHGPGFSKVLLGDDQVDNWEKHLDVMVDSVFANSGRGCINCSGIWASRHGRQIAEALAQRMASVRPLPPEDPAGEPRRVHRAGERRVDLQRHRRRSEGFWRDRRDRETPRRSARVQTGARRVPAADRGALRLPGRRDRVEGIHVPLRDGGRLPAGADAREDRPDARLQRDHVRPSVPRHAGGRRPYRSAESRSGAHDPAQLAAAARGKHRGVPVPGESVPERGLIVAGRELAEEPGGRSDLWQHCNRILSVTAGAASMYCGSCLRDNALAAQLIARGHDVTLIPLYTPLRTDEANVTRPDVLFGGISIYLQHQSALFRRLPRFVDRLLDAPWFIRTFADRSMSVDPKLLGGLTISMLDGPAGVLRKEFDKLVAWVREEPRPDIVTITNSMLIGLARPLADALKAPVCCTLQGESLFLEGLVEPYRSRALARIRTQVADVDRFVAISDFEAAYMRELPADPRREDGGGAARYPYKRLRGRRGSRGR